MTKDFGKDLRIYNRLVISDIMVSVVKNFTMSAVRMGIVVVEDKKTPAHRAGERWEELLRVLMIGKQITSTVATHPLPLSAQDRYIRVPSNR